jgi:hypothetical protein
LRQDQGERTFAAKLIGLMAKGIFESGGRTGSSDGSTATPVAVSSPLSSPAPSPSASAATEARRPPHQRRHPRPRLRPRRRAVARPEGIPDSYWDAEKNTLKVDPAALAKDLKERDELKTFKAAEDVKALSRPQKAEDYKLELPADFKPPARRRIQARHIQPRARPTQGHGSALFTRLSSQGAASFSQAASRRAGQQAEHRGIQYVVVQRATRVS